MSASLPLRGHARKKPPRRSSCAAERQGQSRVGVTLPALLVGLAVVAAAVVGVAHAHCHGSKDQFACKDGSCILRDKMCDGRSDCPDNSDEMDCDAKMCRTPNWYQCALPDGPCLSAELICNGYDNCPGGEDERDCGGRTQPPGNGNGGGRKANTTLQQAADGSGRNCTEYEYTCQTDRTCVPLDFMCDGKRDCADNSDEVAGCLKAQASCRGFFCANRRCLESEKWRCDDVDDCGDGSDELNCTAKCTPDRGKFLCRDNTCLALALACDGKADCPDQSDEAARCNATANNCDTRKCPPAAKCLMLPDSGPECVCPAGYRHSSMLNACMDINECAEMHGLCSQGCENFSGSYRCTCDDSYVLLADNKTCTASSGDEPLLLYTTQVAITGVHLRSQRVFTVAKNLTKVIGVAYDGEHIYWTNIQNEAESIVKARADGTHQEILLTSGLDAPEDLAVDWLTGNIYFSDNVMRHIAVCSNDGLHCSVLATVDVHHPRGIALWPQQGLMFWTDWGVKPMIVRASMDGSQALPIVSTNIHWPNGVALDMHNNRIYWVDAKQATVESVRPDGTDRRVVIADILKHPYGLAVFEDRLYWSDWGTKSIHSCHKFTGKDHRIVTKDRTAYAVHIYHPAKQQKRSDHACASARCSHLCLLTQNASYRCACPDGMQLGVDQLRCVKTHKRQRLFIGIRNVLLEMEHTTFGRHTITETHPLPLYINEMAYNSVNGSVLLADNAQRAIFAYDVTEKQLTKLVYTNLGNVSALAFDHLARTVYWTDAERHVVEAYSLHTHHRAIVCFFSGIEAPIGLAIVPEDGVMFIALRNRRHIHIDQRQLDGRGPHIHAFEEDLGDDDIKFTIDYETRTFYWSDSHRGRISFSDYRNLHAYTFRSRLRRPYALGIVDDELFWSELHSSTIHWTHKSNLGPLKHVEIEATPDGAAITHTMPAQIPLLASAPASTADHPCQHDNGGCSHVCVTLNHNAATCLCPAGLVFRDDTNHTCIETLDCEFRCRSGECLTLSRRCNGRKDCPDGSDEHGCEPGSVKRPKVTCTLGQFMCHNAERCVASERRCDGSKDCSDGSDEEHCAGYDKTKRCHSHQHACNNGQCVDFSAMCDGINDCGDNSDEANCKANGRGVGDSALAAAPPPRCDDSMFQCNSGTCIAKSWECDGNIDCTDGSDEHDKCVLKDCPKDMHRCQLGQCLDARLICDGHNDCGDMSDELNCDKQLNVSCGSADEPMFQCSSKVTLCLEMTAKCNGTAECPRGEDEADCGATCSIYEFHCKESKECIRLDFRCDHDKDCKDGSDELNCERYANSSSDTGALRPTHERACEPHMFDCKDGQCVEMTRVCDGFGDCDNSADEGPQCKTACRTAPHGKPICEHKCRATPTGAICSCFAGYRLDADQRACVDVNECEDQEPCAQLCENTHGSYRCSCYPGFMLRTDKTTCKSIESTSALLFSTFDEVRSMTEQPIALRVLWSTNDMKIRGFDVDVRGRVAYFSTESENVLYKVNRTSGAIVGALAVDTPSKLAVDWITGNVYVISRGHHYGICVCSFAAQMCGIIADANPRETLTAIAVDAYSKRLFYVTTRARHFGQPLSTITIANLDGRKRELLLTKNGGYINAIAAEPYKKQLYYVDLHGKTLQAISYKVGASQKPITILQKDNTITQPSGLSVYENQAYIVNIGSREAIRCQLYGAHHCKAFNLNILSAEDVVVDGASRQPLNTNPCTMAKCGGMCVQAEYGYECMCGSAIVSEATVCPKTSPNAIAGSALLSTPIGEEGASGEPRSHATLITMSVLVGTAALIALGYLYYRRVKQGHRDLNINLHFQNPLSGLGKAAAPRAGGDNDGGASTAATFNAGNERLHFGAPIQRFLRGSSSSAPPGTDIRLETPRANGSVRTLEPDGHMSSFNVVDENDGSGSAYGDDMRTRLVS